MFKLLLGAAIGAAAAWFLDPNEGTRRRKDVQDKAGGLKGKAAEVRGKAAQMRGDGERGPAAERLNDAGLQAKVQSEIFRDPDAPKDKVSVSVEDGTVYLRGELEDQSAIDELREAAGKVEGVRGVESLLHTPASSSA